MWCCPGCFEACVVGVDMVDERVVVDMMVVVGTVVLSVVDGHVLVAACAMEFVVEVLVVVEVVLACASATCVGVGWLLASRCPCLQVCLWSLASVAPHGACAGLLMKLRWFCKFRFVGLAL